MQNFHFRIAVILFLITGIVELASDQSAPPASGIRVLVYGIHVGNNIVYKQQVTNSGNRDVADISVGLNTDQTSPNLPYSKASGGLNAFPVGSDMVNTEVDPASISGLNAAWPRR